MTETVEQFLARGGQITPLDMGYTAFPDGIIPMKPVRARETKETEAAKTQKIEERNKKIREQKNHEPRVRHKKRMSDEQVAEIVLEQKTMLSDFYKKIRHGDKKRFCEMVGVVTKSFDNAKSGKGRFGVETWARIKKHMNDFVCTEAAPKKPRKYKPKETPESIRRLQVVAARKKAEQEGISVFKAPCRIHGMTDYYLHGKQPPRCAKCRMSITKHHREMHKDAEQKDRTERAKLNKERMIEALSKDQKVFTGLCVRCGYTDMKVYISKNEETGYSYRCVKCTYESQARYNLKRNAV